MTRCPQSANEINDLRERIDGLRAKRKCFVAERLPSNNAPKCTESTITPSRSEPPARAGKAPKVDPGARAAHAQDLIEEELFAGGGTCSPTSSWCSSTRPRSTSRARAAGRSAATALKDHRPDLVQMVVGMVLDNAGNPICSTLWPGNATDVTSPVPVAKRLQQHFGVQRVCIVADRGMISDGTMAEIDSRGCFYILGVRMRRSKEAREEVLTRGGRYQTVQARASSPRQPRRCRSRRSGSTTMTAEAAALSIVCRNEDQAVKDAHDRLAILESLVQMPSSAATSPSSATTASGAWSPAPAVIGESTRPRSPRRATTASGCCAQHRNSAPQVALKYKQLWTVEAIFRTMKSQLHTRPIFHKCDDTIRGHVFCSFLALVLRKALQDRL